MRYAIHITVLVVLCLAGLQAVAQDRTIATDAASTDPLKLGDQVPSVTVHNSEGEAISLQSLHATKPVVLVFFRGGWCPICTRHTQELIKIYPQLKEQGVDMLGISPDSVDSSKANINKNSIPFPILSDPDLNAIKAFGLAFQVDDKTVQRYKGFGIDLEKASGREHHSLPIPAIYIVSTDGQVLFAHSDPDYRQRLDAKQILAELAKL